MTEKLRNELFKQALEKVIDNVNGNTSFAERTKMLNNLDVIHSTDNELKAFKALNNEIDFM